MLHITKVCVAALVLIAGWALLLSTTTDEPGRTLVLLVSAGHSYARSAMLFRRHRSQLF
jgi:hypothetical protein